MHDSRTRQGTRALPSVRIGENAREREKEGGTGREREGRRASGRHRRRGEEEESANKLSSRINPQRRLDRPGQTGNKFLREPNRSTWVCSALINRNPENEAVENRVTVSSLSTQLTGQFGGFKRITRERGIRRSVRRVTFLISNQRKISDAPFTF